jgi:hypothetical protein
MQLGSWDCAWPAGGVFKDQEAAYLLPALEGGLDFAPSIDDHLQLLFGQGDGRYVGASDPCLSKSDIFRLQNIISGL